MRIHTIDTLHKSKYEKVKKIGPSQREAEVAMRLFVWMPKLLMQRNVTLYFPL